MVIVVCPDVFVFLVVVVVFPDVFVFLVFVVCPDV